MQLFSIIYYLLCVFFTSSLTKAWLFSNEKEDDGKINDNYIYRLENYFSRKTVDFPVPRTADEKSLFDWALEAEVKREAAAFQKEAAAVQKELVNLTKYSPGLIVIFCYAIVNIGVGGEKVLNDILIAVKTISLAAETIALALTNGMSKIIKFVGRLI